jgi:hypothetical protein
VVEASDVAIERVEQSTSLQGRPNVEKVLPAGVGNNKLADKNDAPGCFGRRVRGVYFVCQAYCRSSAGPRRFFSFGAQGPTLLY